MERSAPAPDLIKYGVYSLLIAERSQRPRTRGQEPPCHHARTRVRSVSVYARSVRVRARLDSLTVATDQW